MSTTAKQTQVQIPNSGKFSGSVGGTMKSMFGGKGRTFFMLEYKTASARYKPGQTEEFMGDYVELGRGQYAVSFGNDCPTVSRPHAAIVRQGEGWVLRPISRSNPTLLNNRPIQADAFLQNGDQIQLSAEGPKMVFLATPAQTVSGLGLTSRLNAMRREVLRPYRTAVTVMSIVLLLTIGGSTYANWYWFDKYQQLEDTVAAGEKAMVGKLNDALQKQKEENDKKVKEIEEKYRLEKERLERERRERERRERENDGNQPSQPDGGVAINETPNNGVNPEPPSGSENVDKPSTESPSVLYPGVFYIRTIRIEVDGKILAEGEKPVGISGTGFFLNDGRFVTARHVVFPWLFPPFTSKPFILANLMSNNTDKEVVHYFIAVNGEGKQIELSSNNFRYDDSGDKLENLESEGKTYKFRFAALRKDWASCKLNVKGALTSGADAACKLNVETPLTVLGYPQGVGAGGNPVHNKVLVARDGCEEGMIWTDQNIDSGNSGGPVFVRTSSGGYAVVGVVSAKIGGSLGVYVPLSSVQ
jgi:hypothetical protein